MNSKKWMAAALAEAARGLGETSPNPAVGAVIVHNEKIVARGRHRAFGRPHAEIEAIADARKKGERLKGATLAVTLEPCDHFGKTPPCTRALIREKFSRVVVGILDPHRIVAGRGIRRLRQAGIRVDTMNDPGVIRFYAPYRTFHQEKRAFVTLKLAMSADGKIARRGRCARWITGPAARREVQRLRRRVDAILVGRRTAVMDNPRLTLRGADAAGRTRFPKRIILAGAGKLPRTLHMLTDGQADTLIVRSGARGRLNLTSLLRILAKQGIIHLLVEGGAATARSFLDAGLVDEIVMFVSPGILGPQGLDAFAPGKPGRGMWRLADTKKFGKDTLLRFLPAGKANVDV